MIGGTAALNLTDVSKSYVDAGRRIEVLIGANLKISPGEMVALVGPSGAGKSTLLHVAGLLDKPDQGAVEIGGVSGYGGGEKLRTRLRRHAIGFVYQFHYLLPEFTALENIIIPQRVAGLDYATAQERARELIAMVGLADRETHRPAQLSGGEQQRVAIARALANAPLLLLADEPTGNLDPGTADAVFTVLRRIVSETGLAALVATHNLDMASVMDRSVTLDNGAVVAV